MLFIVDVDNDGFKVYDSSGTLIDPAKDQSVQDLVTRLGEVSATPTANTVLERLKSVWDKLNSIELTNGIKKIVDALPTGDNWLGRVKLGDGTNTVSVSSGGEAHVVPYDDVNNVALPIVEGTSVGATKPGTLVAGLDPSDNAKFFELDANGRIRVAATTEPTDLSKRVFAALEDSGGATNMYVDGSGTAVEYTFDADASDDIYITQVRIVINAADIQFKEGSGSGTFQKINALTNGLKLEIRTSSTTYELVNFKRDEEFLAFGGNDIIDQTDTSDLLTATYDSEGVLLGAGSGDFVKVTVRDDLENAGHIFLGCWIKGYKK